MTFWTNSFSKLRLAGILLALLLLGGCLAGSPDTGSRSALPETAGGQDLDGGPMSVSLLASPSPEGTVWWRAAAVGGQGDLRYTFLVRTDEEAIVQKGKEDQVEIRTDEYVEYQIKVVVEDDHGARAESSWSEVAKIEPVVDDNTMLAVFPAENLSGVKAPLNEVRQSFSEALSGHNFRQVEEDALQAFMKKYRIRYTGGVNAQTGKLLSEEIGVDAVFILSLESFQEEDPPKVSLIARLVACDKDPDILWMQSVGLSGDEAPGFLGLGIVDNADELIRRAVAELVASYREFLAEDRDRYRVVLENGREFLLGPPPSEGATGSSRYQPTRFYRSDQFDAIRPLSVAVLPFSNKYSRKSAGNVVPLHLIKHLLHIPNINVIEPGVVREDLLKYRIVMQAGPSLAVSDIIASEESVGADLIVAGNVFDYQGLRGIPKVSFSVEAVDTEIREVVWWSTSTATGDDHISFFNVGKVHSAHGLVSPMARAVVSLMVAAE